MVSSVRKIEKVAVLGSGVMGMAIASHLAGCGHDCLVLDIVPFDSMLSEREVAKKATDKSVRNKLAADSLKAALKWKPPQPAFYSKKDASRITIGNFDDDFEKISDCDWIIEVVVERLDIKKQILAKVDKHRKKGSIVSSNTSGLSVAKMTEDCSNDLKEHFLGTHFFNPVRFMKLLEIIPHPQSNPEILCFMQGYCKDVLGKGVILAKDTPNFIANRIGVHGIGTTFEAMQKYGFRIDEVDTICGEVIGNASSAIFKTADLVGIDTLKHVAQTIYDDCPNDEDRDKLQTPEFIVKMIKNGWLGRKAQSGFYKRDGKRKLVLDWQTMEYVDASKPEFASVDAAKKIKNPGERLKKLLSGDDRAAQFAWDLTAGGMLYAARRIPEIADKIQDIDDGMKWGFNRSIGPFEAWDALGLVETANRMKAGGLSIPSHVQQMLDAGHTQFYKTENGKTLQYDLVGQKYIPTTQDNRVFSIKASTTKTKVDSNDGATLWDIGDGVLLYEMHSKMNAIDNETIAMQNRAVELLEADQFDALVLGNDGKNFSVGANLMLVQMAVMSGALDEVRNMVRAFQKANMAMKYSRKPVVGAPVGFCFGGGCELLQHCNRVVGAAESYIGLVEVGVGLLPAGGGTKEMVLRAVENLNPALQVPLLSYVRGSFEAIAKADVAMSFKQAIDIGWLRESDIMVANPEHRITRAKEEALKMAAAGLDFGKPKTDILVAGETATAAFLIAVAGMKSAGWASEHDQKVAAEIATIMGGGARWEGQTISEWELLDMELEGFMRLLQEPKTQERIQYMLMNNKPLRN